MTTEDKTKLHDSDCALHNMPAYPNGECNCSLFSKTTTEKAAIKLRTLANQLDTTIGQSEFFFALAENIEAKEKLIRAQEARIAALTKDAEPVAWRVEELQAQNQWFTEDESDLGTVDCQSANIVVTPLYTHPPAPELKPLSLDEIHQRYKNLRVNEPPHYIDIYRDAEAALGILRGGL